MFLYWLQGQTKVPTNMINTLTSADLVDSTIQALHEILKGLPPPPTPPPTPKPIPKDGKILAFSRDVQQGKLPTTIAVKP